MNTTTSTDKKINDLALNRLDVIKELTPIDCIKLLQIGTDLEYNLSSLRIQKEIEYNKWQSKLNIALAQAGYEVEPQEELNPQGVL